MIRSIKLMLVTLLAILLIGSVAHTFASDSDNAEQTERHCAVQIEPVRSGEQQSTMSEMVCFDNPAGVDGFAETSYLIAKDYTEANYTGWTLSWFGNSPCSYAIFYSVPTMPNGWNDVISSTKGYSNCNTNRLYEYTYYLGSLRTCSPNCSVLGAMDNRTSSRKWFR